MRISSSAKSRLSMRPLLCALMASAILGLGAPSALAGEGVHVNVLGVQISLGGGHSDDSTEQSSQSGSSSSSESPSLVSVSVSSPVLPKASVSVGPVEASVNTSTTSTSSTPETQGSGSETQSGTHTTAVTTPLAQAKVTTPSTGAAQQSTTQSAPSVTVHTLTAATATGTPAATSASSSQQDPAGTSQSSGGLAASKSSESKAAGRAAGTHAARHTKHAGAAGAGSSSASTGTTPPIAGGGTQTGGAGRPANPHRKQAKKTSKQSSDPLSTLGRHIPLGIPVPDWSRPIILGLLLLTLVFATRAILSTRRARRSEQARSAMEGDLLVMQSALVPEVPAELCGLAISASYRPAEGPAAGGDFYDVFALSDERVAILLGDVSGHGHEALKQAALTRYTLRAYLEAGLEPGAALRLAGEVMSDPDFEHYATVIAGIYDQRTATLSYGSCGHPPPLTPSVPGAEVLGGFSAPPLGWGVPTGQRQTVLTLGSGARVCFFSDGLIEARTEEGLLGREGLLATLNDLGESATAADLLAAVRQSATRVDDDMAACVIQQSAGARTLGSARWEELEVDRASVDTDGPDRFLEACGLSAQQRESTLVQAREILSSSHRARMRVKVDPGIEPAAQILPSSRQLLELEENLGLTNTRVSA